MECEMKTFIELGLTVLEITVLKSLVHQLYAEPNFSDVAVDEISSDTNLKKDVVKGVVGSLVKKGIVYVDDEFEGIVYLSDDYWYFHPDWKDEWFRQKVMSGWFREQFGLDTSGGSLYNRFRQEGKSDTEAQMQIFDIRYTEMVKKIHG